MLSPLHNPWACTAAADFATAFPTLARPTYRQRRCSSGSLPTIAEPAAPLDCSQGEYWSDPLPAPAGQENQDEEGAAGDSQPPSLGSEMADTAASPFQPGAGSVGGYAAGTMNTGCGMECDHPSTSQPEPWCSPLPSFSPLVKHSQHALPTVDSESEQPAWASPGVTLRAM